MDEILPVVILHRVVGLGISQEFTPGPMTKNHSLHQTTTQTGIKDMSRKEIPFVRPFRRRDDFQSNAVIAWYTVIIL